MMQQIRQVFAIDFRSLRLYRALLGFAILLDTIYRVPMIDYLYTDNGILPRVVWMANTHGWSRGSILALSGSPYFVGFIFALLATAALMLIFDVEARMSSLIAFILLVSIHNRSFLATYGADNLMRTMLLWSALMPCTRGRLKDGAFVNFASAGAFIELALLYICAGYFKTMESWVWNPIATYLALNTQFFSRELGAWFTAFPRVLGALTIFTFLLERFGWVMLISPWRTDMFRLLAFAAFGGMHAGIACLMDVHLFPLVDLAFLTLILPTSFWNYILERGTHSRDYVAEKLVFLQEGFAVTACSLVLLLLLTSVNLRDVALDYTPMSWFARNVERPFGFAQNWRLFAPKPPEVSGWFAAVGVRDNGQRVDAFNLKEVPPDFSPPITARERLPARKWVEGLLTLTQPGYEYLRRPLAHYLCRRWNQSKHEVLKGVDVYYMWRRTPPPGQRAEHQLLPFASVPCQSD